MTVPTFRVATYNIHSCVGGDKLCNAERVLRVLREIQADVIALQEVGGSSLIEEMEQFRFFEKHLGMRSISASNLRWGRFEFGNALFTRGEIIDSRLVDLTVYPFELRGAIDCVIKLQDVEVRIVATHLGLFPHERRQQIGRLLEMLQEQPRPLTVFMGDFNIFGLERRSLRRIGAPESLPRLRTFPARRPLMSLDRIWTIPNKRLHKIYVHRSALSRAASDHLPIVADIVLDESGAELSSGIGSPTKPELALPRFWF